MMPVGISVPPLIDQLKMSTDLLNQAIDKNAAITTTAVDPPLATSGTLGTKINTYA